MDTLYSFRCLALKIPNKLKLREGDKALAILVNYADNLVIDFS